MNQIPDYSDIRFSVKDMKRFFKDGNIQVDKKELDQLSQILSHYDKVNEKGENKPDGELGLKEDREAFKEELEKQMPGMFDKLLEFFIIVDVVEEDRAMKEAQKNAPKLDTKS